MMMFWFRLVINLRLSLAIAIIPAKMYAKRIFTFVLSLSLLTLPGVSAAAIPPQSQKSSEPPVAPAFKSAKPAKAVTPTIQEVAPKVNTKSTTKPLAKTSVKASAKSNSRGAVKPLPAEKVETLEMSNGNNDNDNEDSSGWVTKNNSFEIMGHISWWILGAVSYHPAVIVKVRNVSGKNLTGQPIHVQARFLDPGTGEVTVARKDIVKAMPNNHMFYVFLRAPQAYELSIDTSEWPSLETKVMCRVGDDGRTQNLLLTNVEPVTMSYDDAFYQINRAAEFKGPGKSRRR